MSTHQVLVALKRRLPELSYQLAQLSHSIPYHALPEGLFKQHPEKPADFVMEIKEDIQRLALMSQSRTALYLAELIRKKINVLVQLCKEANQSEPQKNTSKFLVNHIMTRQQWVQSLENDIERLEEQKQALQASLHQTAHAETSLKIHKSLGEVEKQLTLAKEQYEQLYK